MRSLIVEDPCCLGPNVVGLPSPDQAWALVPDLEKTGKLNQACMMFEAGATAAELLLVDRASALDLFWRLQAELNPLSHTQAAAQEGAAALVGLWNLPSERALLVAADLDGGFARNAMAKVLSSTSWRPVSRLRLDAAALIEDPTVGEATRSALEILTRNLSN